MSKRLKILMTAGLLAALLLCLGMAAGEGSSPAVMPPEIPVTISTQGTPPAVAEIYTVRLTAEGDFPMPGGGTGGSRDLKVIGAVSGAFPAITYSRVGIYTYQMTMVPGSAEGAVYDDTVYYVKVTVSNLADGEFGYTTAIRKTSDMSGDKVPAQFTVIYPVEKTEKTVIKVWDDQDNQDGMRPAGLTVTLERKAADSDEFTAVDTVSLNEEKGWTATVSNLDKYEKDTRTEIIYRWTEGSVTDEYTQSGYYSTGDTTTITNYHEPKQVASKVIKTWDDADDQDGFRPKGSTTVRVYLKDGDTELKSAELSVGNGWTATEDGLPMYRGGEEIQYRWVEKEADYPDQYRLSSQTTSKENGIWVTRLENRHVTDTVQETVVKVWDDDGNRDGKRPESLTVTLLADGKAAKYNDGSAVEAVTLNEENEWTATVTGLPKRAGGKEITYTWEESAPGNGYEYVGTVTSGHITTITNKHTPETREITITKVWDDNDDQDGMRRPVTLQLISSDGNQVVETFVVNEDSGLSKTFTVLKYYSEGKEIVYTVEEDSVPAGYRKKVDNGKLMVTNIHVPMTLDIQVEKVWDDNRNQDGFRAPTAITLTGTAGGETVVTRTFEVTADMLADERSSAEFRGLPVMHQGEEIQYSVSETAMERYEAPKIEGSVSVDKNVEGGNAGGGTFTVTNKHTPETLDISGEKIWDDADDQDGKRPEKVTVNLIADGEQVKSVEIGQKEEWKFSFKGLPKYADGKEIEYTVTENAVDEYEEPDIAGSVSEGFRITNRHTPETVEASVRKVWNDGENQDGIRPASLTVTLLGAGTAVQENGKNVTRTLDEGNGWSASVSGLPKYKAGQEIKYTWSEETPAGYSGRASTADLSTVLTNTHVTEETVATITKTWVDAENQDGFRPESVTVTLLADGKPAVYNDGTAVAPVTLSEKNKWVATVTGLPLNASGKAISYTWTESLTGTAAEKYEQTRNVTRGTITSLRNTHTPETVDVEGRKVWDDAENQDGLRPESVKILLKADGEQIDSATVTGADGWAYSFINLPKYRKGKEIEYTVDEEAVEGYTTVIDGTTVTNSHQTEETKVSVRKVWDDADNQDGARPGSVTVMLFANGDAVTDSEDTAITAVLSEENEWTHTFEKLPKNRNGKPIAYTVKEEKISGYDAPKITGSMAEGYTITNSRAPETVDIAITKTWVDDNNRDGARPASITVRLLQNSEEYQTVTLRAPATGDTNIWSYRFTGLPKYTAGVENRYRVEEVKVEGYTTEINAFAITNTHEIARTNRTIVKVWENDDNNAENTRPETVTMTLTANGVPARDENNRIITRTLSAANNWRATVEDLPVYENGKKITYRWTESEVPGYELSGFLLIRGTDGETIRLTNRYNRIYNLTVIYEYLLTGEPAAPPVNEEHPEGEEYDVPSPEIPGYKTTKILVSGIMPGRDVIEYVYYIPMDTIIDDFETPLGLGQVFINVGDCLE